MLIEPEQLHVEYLIGVATSGDNIAWACQALADAFATNDIVCEIASLNTSDRYERERAAALLSQLVARRGFVVNSPRAVIFAQEALRRACERYLAGEIPPYDLCRLVSPIEQVFDFPRWLGNLYNACDWIEPETKREDVPHLEDEVTAMLAGLGDENPT